MIYKNLLILIIQSFWFIAPAYAANAFPPVIKGKRPIDFNKTLWKKPILGKGKTIEGTIGGILFGIFVGLVQLYFQPFIKNHIPLIELSPLSIVLLSVGAIVGDIVASFFKRRAGIKRGEPVPLMDQLDFIIGAFVFTYPLIRLPVFHLLFIIIITPIIHLLANGIGFIFKLKKVPY